MEKASEAAAKALKEAGVKFVFGVPGGEITDLMEGLRNQGVQFILTHHEATAAFMAGAVGELTGVPGVCAATLGPGATNLVSGVAHAYLDRSPIIAFTGQMPGWRRLTDTHQVLDLQALFAPITKWHCALEPKRCREAILKAVDVACSERPGPVYIEVPADAANQETESPEPCAFAVRYMAEACTPDAFLESARLLQASFRPVLVVGAAALRSKCDDALREFVDLVQIPVLATPKGKGLFPEDHDCFVGTLEMLGSAVLFELLDSSDFVVSVGVDAVELMRRWQPKPGICLDLVPNLDHYYTCSIEMVGPIGKHLSLLSSAVSSCAVGPKWSKSEIRDWKRRLHDSITVSGAGFYPAQLFSVMNRVLPEDTMMSCDVGAHKFATGQLWQPKRPRTFLVSNGLSSMGYGLASAIAAKLVHPKRPSVTVVGDGGLLMYAGELETAARLGTAVIIVVCADRTLSLIKMNQERKGYPPCGVEFTSPDWTAVARGMGLGAVRVETGRDLADALELALSWQGPFLIEAQIDPAGYRTR